MENDKANAVSYCGLYCVACPSVHRGSCFGCRSDDKTQKRKSKWRCNIRDCCINDKKIEYCGCCIEYSCPTILKLINSHKNETRMHYRHEIPNNFKELNKIGIDKWAREQEKLWRCPNCEGSVVFWDYKCLVCGMSYDPQNKNNKGEKKKW